MRDMRSLTPANLVRQSLLTELWPPCRSGTAWALSQCEPIPTCSASIACSLPGVGRPGGHFGFEHARLRRCSAAGTPGCARPDRACAMAQAGHQARVWHRRHLCRRKRGLDTPRQPCQARLALRHTCLCAWPAFDAPGPSTLVQCLREAIRLAHGMIAGVSKGLVRLTKALKEASLDCA